MGSNKFAFYCGITLWIFVDSTVTSRPVQAQQLSLLGQKGLSRSTSGSGSVASGGTAPAKVEAAASWDPMRDDIEKIDFVTAGMRGGSLVLVTYKSAETRRGTVTLVTDDTERWKRPMASAGQQMYPFDYNWLAPGPDTNPRLRAPEEIVGYVHLKFARDGEESIETLWYRATKKKFDTGEFVLSYGIAEGLGIHAVDVTVSGDYLRYECGTYRKDGKITWDAHPSVWTTTLGVVGKWLHHKDVTGGQGNIFGFQSPYGKSGEKSVDRPTFKPGDPPSISADHRPSRPRPAQYGTEARFEYKNVLGQWFEDSHEGQAVPAVSTIGWLLGYKDIEHPSYLAFGAMFVADFSAGAGVGFPRHVNVRLPGHVFPFILQGNALQPDPEYVP